MDEPAGGVLRGRRFIFCEAAKKEPKKRLLRGSSAVACVVRRQESDPSWQLSGCDASPQPEQDAAYRFGQLLGRLNHRAGVLFRTIE